MMVQAVCSRFRAALCNLLCTVIFGFMRRLLLLYVFPSLIVLPRQSFSQELPSKSTVYLSPAVLQPFSLAAQGGVQHRKGEKWAFLAEAAVPVWRLNHSYLKLSGWRTSIETKYSLRGFNHKGKYFSLQASYFSRTITDTVSGYLYLRDGRYRYDAAVVKSPVLAFALKFGHEITAPDDGTICDVFIGLGVRHLFTRYTAQNLQPEPISGTADNFAWILGADAWRYKDPVDRFHFVVGFRFGWKL